MTEGARPLVLLDVDGPLQPWAGDTGTRPAEFVRFPLRRSWWWGRAGFVWLNPAHGPALLGLAERTGAELVWATAWGQRANLVIGPAVGLPELPVIEFVSRGLFTDEQWKFAAVARFAYDRPLVWFDDDFELRPAAKAEFLARLRDAELAAAEAWLLGLAETG